MKNKNLMITYIGLLISLVAGVIVGVSWSINPNISLGEASCGAILTMILMLSMFIWSKLNLKRNKNEH